MAVFFGNQAAFTPGTAQNWVLDANDLGDIAMVLEVSWGGELTTSTAQRTRWLRPTTDGSGTFTAVGAVQSSRSGAVAKNRFGTFATAPVNPTAPAALYATSWNAHGGIGRWLAAPGEEWLLIHDAGNQLVCINDVGAVATSMSAGCGWKED